MLLQLEMVHHRMLNVIHMTMYIRGTSASLNTNIFLKELKYRHPSNMDWKRCLHVITDVFSSYLKPWGLQGNSEKIDLDFV